MGDDLSALQIQVAALEKRIAEQEAQQKGEWERLNRELTELSDQHRASRREATSLFVRRVEWTISKISEKRRQKPKGESIFSPKFAAAGLADVQLEFFPNGREKTTYDGFCSVFLWCPPLTLAKYQLFVGSFFRAPDSDEYATAVGHGHSNFCPVSPEINTVNDEIVVGVIFLEVSELNEEVPFNNGLRLLTKPIDHMIKKEVEVVRNKNVSKVIWKIPQISKRIDAIPRGVSMYSPSFTAAGVRDISLELYPNGSVDTKSDGFCAFYLKATKGTTAVVTLFVGKAQKGPIKIVFEEGAKGLPDFCRLADQIDVEEDLLEVGIELKHEMNPTLTIES